MRSTSNTEELCKLQAMFLMYSSERHYFEARNTQTAGQGFIFLGFMFFSWSKKRDWKRHASLTSMHGKSWRTASWSPHPKLCGMRQQPETEGADHKQTMARRQQCLLWLNNYLDEVKVLMQCVVISLKLLMLPRAEGSPGRQCDSGWAELH